MYFTKSTAAASALFVSSAVGHMVMNTPTPYGFADLQTSPLNGQNYLFPCQSGSRTDAFNANGVSNPVTAGGNQKVAFTGSAVHGGGSCQFSVTYEYPPPADPSKWKVIHTVIGGCPTTATGNLANNGNTDADGRPTAQQCTGSADGSCLRQFEVPIPKQLKNGNATFAWTWFNKIGNREMYMNCAPMTISGGADDDSFLNTLPEMFVANIPGKCTTVEGVLNIPNPGKSVEVLEQPSAGASGSCAAGGNVGSASSAAPAASASSAVASSPVASSPVASYSASAPAASSAAASVPGVFAPGAGGASATGASSAVASSAAASTPVATPTFATVVQSSVAAGTGGAAAPTGGASGDKVACSNEGGVVCMGTDYFGLCDHGFAVKMAVATGTKCENGQVARRSVPRKHLHARIHGHS